MLVAAANAAAGAAVDEATRQAVLAQTRRVLDDTVAVLERGNEAALTGTQAPAHSLSYPRT